MKSSRAKKRPNTATTTKTQKTQKTPKTTPQTPSHHMATPAEVEAIQARIRHLLEEGLTAQQVARAVGRTPKRIHDIANKRGYPTNPTIFPHSHDENSIARCAAAGWAVAEIAKVFKHSPASIRAILERISSSPLSPESVRFRGQRPSPQSHAAKQH